MADKRELTQPHRSEAPLGNIHVRVKAVDTHRNDDGTWTIVFRGKPLTEAEINTLREFYPTLFPTAISLFHKEALLQSVVDEF